MPERPNQPPAGSFDLVGIEDEQSSITNSLLPFAILTALGAVGNIHRLPQVWRTRGALFMEDALEKLRNTPLAAIRRVLPDIADDLGGQTRFAIDKQLKAATTTERRLRGLHVDQDLDVLARVFRQRGIEAGGSLHDVTDAILDRYFIGNVKTYAGPEALHSGMSQGPMGNLNVREHIGGYQSVSFQHLEKMASTSRHARKILTDANPWMSSVLKGGENLRTLMAIPSFKAHTKSFLESKGIKGIRDRELGQFFALENLFTTKGSLAVGKGFEKDILGATFRSTSRFKPTNILKSIAQWRLPFTQHLRPFSLMMPTELIGRGPTAGFVGKELAEDLSAKRGAAGGFSDTLIAGGRVYGIRDVKVGGRVVNRRMGEQLGEGYRIGRRRSGMGRGYTARMGLETQLQTREKLLKSVRTPDFIEKLGYGEQFRKAIGGLARFGEKLGISPQFRREVPDSGLLGNILRGSHAKSSKEAQIVEKYASGNIKGISAVTAEGEWLRKKVNQIRGFMGLKPMKQAVESPQSIEDLTALERLQLAMGREPRRYGLEEIEDGVFEVRRQRVARFGTNKSELIADHFEKSRGQFGFKTGEGVSDFVNYLFGRVGWLLQEGFGLGLKMGRSPLGTAGRWLGLAGTLYGASQVARYVDYKLKAISGFSPTELGAGAMVYTHYGQLQAQEALGITGMASKAEELFPGIESSFLSKGLRGGAFLLGGVVLGKKFGRGSAGFIGGLTAAVWQMTTDFTKDPEEYRQEITGEKKVEVKRARWWGLGRQPFEGEGVEAYVPHWYQRMRSDYRDVSIYGSASESWRESWLPTPENLFLLKNLFDPYYLERRHYHSRPYPVSAPLFHEVPMVGPALSASIGRMIKPTTLMHHEATRLGPAGPSNGISGYHDSSLGYQHLGNVIPSEEDYRARLEYLTADTIYALKEFSGLPGFMYEAMTKAAGMQVQKSPMLADAGKIASASREFYDMNLGGMMTYTELARRFLTPDNKWDTINHLENPTTPDWLPGRNSAFERDRKSVMDFHTGDPYSRITMGEARLPGPGYEALNKLHSGTPGVYDPMDRFLVLSDVAPSSAAYRTYKTIAEGWVKAGVVDEEWTGKYYRALENAEKKLHRLPEDGERKFTRQNFFRTTLTIESVLGPGKFKAGGRTYDLAGVETDLRRLQALENLDPSQVREHKQRLQTLQQDMQSLVGQSVNAAIGMRRGSAFPVVLDGVNQKYIGQGLFSGDTDALSTYARYGNQPLSQAWENMRHGELPGPLGWPLNKLFTRYDAVERYRREIIEGADFAGWNDPVRNFMKPWVKQTIYSLTGNHEPWSDTVAIRETDKYFDRLKYYKYRRLQKYAEHLGDMNGARMMEEMWRQTMIGMQAPGANWMRDAYGAIPARERKYFERFKYAQDDQDRQKILRMVPQEMKPVYLGIWNQLDPATAHEGTPVTFEQLGAMPESPTSQYEVDAEVANFFASNALPDDEWLGWTPSVSMSDMKLVTMETAGKDIHDYGLYQSQAEQLRSYRPYLYMQPAFGPQRRTGNFNNIMSQFGQRSYANNLGYNRLRYRLRTNYNQLARRSYRERGGSFHL